MYWYIEHCKPSFFFIWENVWGDKTISCNSSNACRWGFCFLVASPPCPFFKLEKSLRGGLRVEYGSLIGRISWNLWWETENVLQQVRKNKGSKERRVRCGSRCIFTLVHPSVNKLRFESYWTLINSPLLGNMDSLNQWWGIPKKKS